MTIPGFEQADAERLAPPERELPEDGDPRMERLIVKIMEARAQYIDMLAAAFLKEVGSGEASKYILVETREGTEISWRFERKT